MVGLGPCRRERHGENKNAERNFLCMCVVAPLSLYRLFRLRGVLSERSQTACVNASEVVREGTPKAERIFLVFTQSESCAVPYPGEMQSHHE